MDGSKIVSPSFKYSSNTSEYYLTSDSWSSMVVINRENCEVSVDNKNLQGKIKESYGFLGIFHLKNASYVVSITDVRYVASINDCLILMISNVDFLPLTTLKDPEVDKFTEFIKSNYFYFSYEFDLTAKFQCKKFMRNTSTWESSDTKYFWNYHLTEAFRNAMANELILPVISGFVQIEQVQIEGISVDFGIISRRDHRRAGTRFHTRGVDSEGNAANFVETEQVLGWNEDGKYRLHSYIQVRGSVPVVWTQNPNLAWTPPIRITDINSGTKHISELINHYKQLAIINLVDKKGSQLNLGNSYQQLANEVSECLYFWFDFHAECRGLKYENLSNLVDLVKDLLDSYEWDESIISDFKIINNGNVVKSQSGVFRVNCVDCLDRTNVVQSLFGRYILHKQLAGIVHKKSSDPLGIFPENLEFCFRNFWTNNADVLSEVYTGTPAQKTDFTRTGKRTFKGAVLDLKCGVKRYVINNFLDGSRKTMVDVFLGKSSPSKIRKSHKYSNIVTFVFLLIFVYIICHLMALKVSDGWSYYLMFFINLGIFYKLSPVFGRKFVESP